MLNAVTLMGRLTRDPELNYFKNGDQNIPVVNFTLAVDRNYKNSNGEKKTDFFDVEAWRHTAEFLDNYFTKGQQMCVEGRLKRDDWLDKENNKRTSYKIVARNVYFADSKRSVSKKNNNSRSGEADGITSVVAESSSDDDLPF